MWCLHVLPLITWRCFGFLDGAYFLVLIQPWLQAVPRCAERLISLSEDLKLPLILLSRREDLAVGMFQREVTVVKK